MTGSTELTALHTPFKNPKYIFFTDFDGTITMKDSNDLLMDNLGLGYEKRRAGNHKVLDGTMNFRQFFEEQMDNVHMPFDECIDYLISNIKLDPHFNEFFQWALANNIPTVVLSSGIEPVIRAILKSLVGPDHVKIEIVANAVVPRDGKNINDKAGWKVKFHDDSGFGHDKSLTIRPYGLLPPEQRPTLFYAGDGISDFSAARETDLLFAKKGYDLVTYCIKDGTPFTLFEDWSSILSGVKRIVNGEITVQDAANEGYELYKKGEAGVPVQPN